MKKDMDFILASTSPRRRELLHKVIAKYDVLSPDVEEICGLTEPKEIVKDLATQKGIAACEEIIAKGNLQNTCVVISADTLVAFEGKVLGKPQSKDEAYQMLTVLQEKWHSVFSGVAIFVLPASCNATSSKILHAIQNPEVFCAQTKVFMAKRTKQQTLDYIKGGSPMDKAGAYGIQDLDGALVTKIEGSYDNVMGLPTEQLKIELEKLGLI